MARIDDYRQAAELARQELRTLDPEEVARAGGAGLVTDSGDQAALKFSFLNRALVATWPDLEFSYSGSDDEVTLQQQVLLLHYLKGACGAQEEGGWISYQEVPDGKFYLDAFLRRAKNPMVQAFGENPEAMVQIAKQAYGATDFEQGDCSVVVQALPRTPVALVMWKGDDEFPPEGNILFDKSISGILSAEDIAWLAGMVVYPLMGMARAQKK